VRIQRGLEQLSGSEKHLLEKHENRQEGCDGKVRRAAGLNGKGRRKRVRGDAGEGEKRGKGGAKEKALPQSARGI